MATFLGRHAFPKMYIARGNLYIISTSSKTDIQNVIHTRLILHAYKSGPNMNPIKDVEDHVMFNN